MKKCEKLLKIIEVDVEENLILEFFEILAIMQIG